MEYNKKIFNQIASNCTAEYVHYAPRSKNGLRSWEIKAVNADGICKVVVLKDCGIGITGEVIEMTPFASREERNALICQLYKKGLSQVFIAELLKITQSSVSIILTLMKHRTGGAQ